MAEPRSKDARLFYRVAGQRLEDAELLLANDRGAAAVYLAGYAIECMLKSLLLHRTPARDRQAVVKSFRGPQGHSLDWLFAQLAGVGVFRPSQLTRSYGTVISWSVELRYDPGVPREREVTQFIEAVKDLVDWANRSM